MIQNQTFKMILTSAKSKHDEIRVNFLNEMASMELINLQLMMLVGCRISA